MSGLEVILRDGFDTLRRNLNLIIPFILQQVITWITVAIVFLALYFTVLAPIIPYLERMGVDSSPSPEVLLKIWMMIAPSLPLLITAFILLLLFFALLDAFIWAGAIGMARRAIETGRSTLGDMIEYGKKKFLSVFVSNLIITVLSMLGFSALIPGIIALSSSRSIGPLLLLLGVLIMVLYLIFITLSLYLARFAIVVDDVGAIEGIKRAYRVFTSNKLDLLLLALVILAISLVISLPPALVGMLLSFIPIVGWILEMMISLLLSALLSALILAWFTHFYIDRKQRSPQIQPPSEPL
ncbi:MAG TPA: hypothetical protein ENI32_07205 [Candidatus Syntrophoarchaeum butanivorans]|uniref:DUF7847 domain-containing protein n=1 Tax=Candidatus Syntropharchaeum butanivorans TaxID=1839936 RepID=A0A7J2S2N8_9EURY|nr:hypothetical protein [Candidatus Syntrophoarchaeum butanivorans]